MSQKVKIIRNEIDPEPVEVIAQSIADVADAMKAIHRTRLSLRAVALLVKDQTNLGMGDIFKVLNSLQSLEKQYLKPTSK